MGKRFYYTGPLILPDKEGEICFQQDEEGKTKILRADPKILISHEFAYRHNDEKYVKCDDHPWKIGSVIVLKDDYGTNFTYVIKDEDFLRFIWIAEWPD